MGFNSIMNKAKRRIKASVVLLFDTTGIRKAGYADRVIRNFRPDLVKGSREYRRLKKDLIISEKVNSIAVPEYFLFGFEKMNAEERSTYIGKREKGAFTRFINKNEDWKLFNDKYRTYQRLKDWYHRDVDRITGADAADKTKEYLTKHEACIIKPHNLSCGRGVIRVNRGDDVEKAVEGIESGLIEEYIRQDGRLGIFHPSSVNTVRVTTYLKKDGAVILYALFRMGANNSVVDNAGAGGIIAALDEKTGVICTPGWREDCTTYEKHPDTGVQILGAHIPEWDALTETVKQLAAQVPTQKLIGWDMTLTDRGWTVIEGNNVPAFTGIQMCSRKGIRAMMAEQTEEYERFI